MSKLVLRTRKIVCRNFSGKGSMYNKEGNRNFLLILESDEVDELRKQGYNVKQFKPNEDGTDGAFYIQVAVNIGAYRKPKIVLVKGAVLTTVDVNQVSMLDYVDIDSVDISIDPYKWELPTGQSGTKAYLSTLYVKVREDEFAQEYEEDGYIDSTSTF